MQFNIRRQVLLATILATSVTFATSVTLAQAAPDCPIDYGSYAAAKPNKLFLLFPSADITEPTPFPTHGFNPNTAWLPLVKFDPTRSLPNYRGTEAELRDAIHGVVRRIYCEFNVHVVQTTTVPTTADGDRRNTVGIGTDKPAGRPCDRPPGPLRGQNQSAGGDVYDRGAVDFSRVWAGTFQDCATGPDMPLRNAETDKWAWSIGSSAAHEAGHSYGLSHFDGLVKLRTGDDGSLEDPRKNHTMRPGENYLWTDFTNVRHFSDHEYSILAGNIGLAMDTMWSWDLTNPNAGGTPNAAKLRMEFLSVKPSLLLSWAYSGDAGPWVRPVLTGPLGERQFNNKTYNVYRIEWSTGRSWSGGPPGQVPNGKKFHVGVTFSSVSGTDPDATIITDVTLLDASNNALPQQPHWMGFDSATLDPNTGFLNLRFFNPLDRPLILRDVVVRDLPRVMSVDAMIPNEAIRDYSWRKVPPWEQGTRRPLSQQTVAGGGEISVRVASVPQTPHIYRRLTERDCPPTDSGFGRLCRPGTVLIDLFPATAMYIRATVVDPQGRLPNDGQKRAGTRSVESELYFQIAGRRVPLEVRLPPRLRSGATAEVPHGFERLR